MKHNKLIFKFLILAFASIFIQRCSVQSASTYTPSLKDSAQVFYVGKTVFDVVIKDQTQKPASGLVLEVDPQMDMGTFIHNTPVESITDNKDGSYTVIAYFLMTGAWTLHFHANGDHMADHIAVTVVAVNGDGMLDKGTLKGVSDMILPQTGATIAKRNYFIFKSNVNTSTGAVDLFLATRDNYLSHPAVFSGQILTSETGAAWTVGTVTLSVCTIWGGTTCTTWTNLTDNGNGHFTGSVGAFTTDTNTSMMATGNQFAVHLSVANSDAANNGWKTTDGTLSGANPGTGNGVKGAATADEFTHINQ